MMGVTTMRECGIHPMEILTDQTARIHKAHGTETIKLRVHIYRKFVRRREKTETTNLERNILVRFQYFALFLIKNLENIIL